MKYMEDNHKKTFKELHEEWNITTQKATAKTKKRNHQGGDMVKSGYDVFYDKIFDSLRDIPINLLEIGILQGLKMFILSKYLTEARFYGIDIDIDNFNNYPHDDVFKKRVKNISMVDTNNKKSTDKYKTQIKKKFHVIIDDGDHNPTAMITTFEAFYEKLKDNGVYIIEDVRKPKRLNIVSKYFDEKKIEYEFMINKDVMGETGNGIIVIYKKNNINKQKKVKKNKKK